MARRATGQVVEPTGRRLSWTIRFCAYGRRQHVALGRPEDGWTRQRAEAELADVLAAVRLGQWQPDEAPAPPAAAGAPTFHGFASRRLDGRRGELRPRTVADYEWALSYHLLPFFHYHHLPEITIAEVDRYSVSTRADRQVWKRLRRSGDAGARRGGRRFRRESR